jgi:ribosomal protein L40E
MVQFCPKCGTQAPDDEAVFCNKCGSRLPPVIPEKKENICPRCGTKAPDEQSTFCNRCGSPLNAILPVQARQAGVRPPADPPVIRKRSCPSCGAPLVDETSDYCNICGADIRGHVPLTPAHEPPRHSPEKPVPAPLPLAREPAQPFPENMLPGTPVADKPGVGKEQPVKKKGWKSVLKWGVIALVLIIILVAAAVFIPGMISGTNQSATTPVPEDETPLTALPTLKTTRTTAPVLTTVPAKVTTKPVPTTAKTNASTTVSANVSRTITTNTSTNATTNASVTVKKTVAITNTSKVLSIGETATDGKGKLTVNGVTLKDKMGDPTPSYAIGKKYMIVDITYENLQQNVTAEPNISGMLLKDGGGYSYDQVTDVTLEKPFTFFGKTVPPQEKVTGNMLYIVPPGATLLTFQYDFGNQFIVTYKIS